MGGLGEFTVRQHPNQDAIDTIHRLNNPAQANCAMIGPGREEEVVPIVEMSMPPGMSDYKRIIRVFLALRKPYLILMYAATEQKFGLHSLKSEANVPVNGNCFLRFKP